MHVFARITSSLHLLITYNALSTLHILFLILKTTQETGYIYFIFLYNLRLRTINKHKFTELLGPSKQGSF